MAPREAFQQIRHLGRPAGPGEQPLPCRVGCLAIAAVDALPGGLQRSQGRLVAFRRLVGATQRPERPGLAVQHHHRAMVYLGAR